MDPVLFWAFLVTTSIFVLVPGPSVALASAQAVRFGRRAALVTVAGDALGTIVHIIVATAGLRALIGLSEIVLPWLQIAGGLYIIWLAWQNWQHRNNSTVSPAADATFWTGFFACVSNPKAIAFFVALFPGFISLEHSVAFQALVYGGVFLVLDAASILIYAFLAEATFRRTISRWLRIELANSLGLFGVGIAMIVKGYRELPGR